MDEKRMIHAKIRILIRALNTEDDYELNYASKELVDIGKTAVPQLIDALENANNTIKYGVVSVLGHIKDESAVPALIDALLNCDLHFVRNDAAKALGWIGHPSAIPALKDALQDSDLRPIAIDALSKIKDPSLAEFFIDKLGNGKWFERRAAAKSLGDIGGANAIETLSTALSAKEDSVREEAADALIKIVKRFHIKDLKKLESILERPGNDFLFAKEKVPGIFIAKLRTAIEIRRNELTKKQGILLDDKPKPPNGNRMYWQLRRVRNG